MAPAVVPVVVTPAPAVVTTAPATATTPATTTTPAAAEHSAAVPVAVTPVVVTPAAVTPITPPAPHSKDAHHEHHQPHHQEHHHREHYQPHISASPPPFHQHPVGHFDENLGAEAFHHYIRTHNISFSHDAAYDATMLVFLENLYFMALHNWYLHYHANVSYGVAPNAYSHMTSTQFAHFILMDNHTQHELVRMFDELDTLHLASAAGNTTAHEHEAGVSLPSHLPAKKAKTSPPKASKSTKTTKTTKSAESKAVNKGTETCKSAEDSEGEGAKEVNEAAESVEQAAGEGSEEGQSSCEEA